jgi:hypothetical protein
MEKYIGENEKLIDFFSYKYTLLDGKLKRIDIHYEGYELVIDLYIEILRVKTDKDIKLTFRGVQKYYFNGTRNSVYDIERYKFFPTDNGYYISLDPFLENEIVAPEDNDIILSKTIEGSFI